MTTTVLAYIGAAFAEIAGGFAFWSWLRLGKSVWWITLGLVSLALFAWLLTLVDSALAERAYAAYGERIHRGVVLAGRDIPAPSARARVIAPPPGR